MQWPTGQCESVYLHGLVLERNVSCGLRMPTFHYSVESVFRVFVFTGVYVFHEQPYYGTVDRSFVSSRSQVLGALPPNRFTSPRLPTT